MVQTEEGWLTVKDGTKLYTKTWKPDSPPVATVVFFHGFSDHCNAYYNLFPTLADNYAIQTHTLDQRGWGRSVQTPSSRGLTGPTPLVLSDMHDFIHSVSTTTHLFVMAHSMGGAQALHYLLSPSFSSNPTQPHISGLILESPYISLHPSTQPSSLTITLGTLASYLLPSKQLVQTPPAKWMSRNPSVCTDWSNDALCHDTGTLQGMSGMLTRGAELVALSTSNPSPSGLSATLPCPLWLGHGTDDHVTSYDASRNLFEKLTAQDGDKVFRAYEGAYHKLHAEPEGVAEEFVRDVGEWIIKRAGTKTAGKGEGEMKREEGAVGSQSTREVEKVGVAKL